MMIRRKSFRTSRAAVLLLALGAAGPALGWDPNTHVTIVQAALRLSPAAETRIPSEYRDAFFHEVKEADPRDRDCRSHRGPRATLDPALEAEKLFPELAAPQGQQRTYHRVQVLGRFLHYVADCAAPRAIAQGKMLPNFFANRNFVVFREPGRLESPLAASLHDREKAAEWAEDDSGAYSSVFRQAVNLTLDALMALPPSPGAHEARDPGEVIFVVNRLDSGLSSRSTTYSTGRGGRPTADLLDRPGVSVVEWAAGSSGNKSTAKALLFNNRSECATEVVLKAGNWSAAVAGAIPPGALRRVELEAPAGVTLDLVRASYTLERCRGGEAPGNDIRTDKRIVIEGGGIANPQFGGGGPSSR